MSKCKVIVAEDGHCFFQGITTWLEDQQNFSLYHKPVGWEELQEMARNRSRLIVITSLQWINSLLGLPAFDAFLKSYSHLHVLCIIRKDVEYQLSMLLTSGIRGILDWTATREEFLFGLNEIAQNRIYISSRFPDGPVNGELALKTKLLGTIILTRREKEVLSLICEGLTDKEIGDRLSLSKRTVDGYRANLMSKFSTRHSTLMVKVALENHLV